MRDNSSRPRSPSRSMLVLSRWWLLDTRDSRNILSSHTSSRMLRAVLATVRDWSASCLTRSSTPYTAMLGTPIRESTPTHRVAYTRPCSELLVKAFTSKLDLEPQSSCR